MAAAIENYFGIEATLIGGHGGIFEIKVNGNLIFNNQQEGGQFPDKETIFKEIQHFKAPISDGEIGDVTLEEENPAPSCKWPR